MFFCLLFFLARMYSFKPDSPVLLWLIVLSLFWARAARCASAEELKTSARFPVPVRMVIGGNSTKEENLGTDQSAGNHSAAETIINRFPIPASLSARDRDGALGNRTSGFVPRNPKNIRTSSENEEGSRTFEAARIQGGIVGHTNSFGTTAPSRVFQQPSPSYSRPGIFSRPVEGTSLGSSIVVPILPTLRPDALPYGSGFSTTGRPVFTSTFIPGFSTTFGPSTGRPIVTTSGSVFSTTAPAPTSRPSTVVPIIGGGEEEEEEELDVPLTGEGSVGRSLFTGTRKRTGGSVKKKANALARESAGKTLAQNFPGARGMELREKADVVTDFVFSDIKCYRSKSKEYFGATIHMKTGYHIPYIRDRPQDPLTSSDCTLERLDTSDVRYRISATDLRACGVEQCGDSLCLAMVFPRVPTLALADDEVTTIKCLPQQSSVTETQAISFSGDSLQNRRSSSTVEGGGQDFAAEVGLFRQNPGSANGLFAKRVSSGGVVQLGEPLQMRSVVRGGDGWYHSKLSDVKVWRMREDYAQRGEGLSTNEASEVITLVDPNGCRNPEYEVLAESHPERDARNSLVHHFNFRAFLFRGQRATEPLIVTAKVQACQEAGECRLVDCSSRSTDPGARRYKRAIERHNASAIIHDYNSQFALHVVGLRENLTSLQEKQVSTTPAPPAAPPVGKSALSFSCTEKMLFSAIGGVCTALFLCGLVASYLFYWVSKKRAEALKSQSIESAPGAGENIYTNSEPSSETVPKQRKPLPPIPPVYENQVMWQCEQITQARDSSAARKKLCESLPEAGDKQRDEGVVVVYCCKKDKKKRGSCATSAPCSVRRKNRQKNLERFLSMLQDTDDTEESDGYYASESPRPPRTVREVKRSQEKYKASGIRRKLSSIYREVYGNRHRGGSFPARISSNPSRKSCPSKNPYGSMKSRRSIYYREGDRNDIYSEDFSSDMDGTPGGVCAICSKDIIGGSCKCGALRRNVEHVMKLNNGKNRKDNNKAQSGNADLRTSVGYPRAPLPTPPDEVVGSTGLPPDVLTTKTPNFKNGFEALKDIGILPETDVAYM